MSTNYKIKNKKEFGAFNLALLIMKNSALVVETKRKGRGYQHVLLQKEQGKIERMNIEGFKETPSLEYIIYEGITQSNERILNENRDIKTLYVPRGTLKYTLK